MSDAKLPISVHTLSWNSGATLTKALQNVQDCTEIIVIDGGSSDNTLQIASDFQAKVIPQRENQKEAKPIEDFAAVRNRGLEHTTQPWVLILDSDEIISEELIKELKEIALYQTEPAAYEVPRKYIDSSGTVIEHASTYPNKRIYFFHRDAVKQWIKKVHERVELRDGIEVHTLRGASLAPLPTIEEFKKKNLQYLQIEAARDTGKGWMYWLKHRLYHTVRSRCIGFVRLLWIWLIPRSGKRLPLKHELLRFWYGWKLIMMTCPIYTNEKRANA